MEIPAEYGNGCRITKKTEIVICDKCLGSGEVRFYTDNPRYEGPWWEQCPRCKGSGRLIMTVVTEFLPVMMLTDSKITKAGKLF